jgi:hypothetical protein
MCRCGHSATQSLHNKYDLRTIDVYGRRQSTLTQSGATTVLCTTWPRATELLESWLKYGKSKVAIDKFKVHNGDEIAKVRDEIRRVCRIPDDVKRLE